MAFDRSSYAAQKDSCRSRIAFPAGITGARSGAPKVGSLASWLVRSREDTMPYALEDGTSLSGPLLARSRETSGFSADRGARA